ncbi:MAG: carbon-nitrogen hydrolase family protein [Candidatus Dormibacteraeota bacterium]|nr:carbon-nitrogen hydrolase family protein [Candidatus Dormibacteraeota bacterium]
MRVALAQIAVRPEKAENLERIRALTAEAAREGAALAVFPEAAMAPFGGPGDSLGDVAEPLDGPFASALSGLARQHRVALTCGLFEPAPGRRVLNTVVTYGPEGGLLGAYRKVHLYDAFGFLESDKIEPGAGELVTFALGGFSFGVMTCYDVRFPETARLLVDHGADVLVLPAAWVPGPLKEEHWEVLVRARAIENTVYVLAADATGVDAVGSSLVVDPMGVAVARAGEAETLLLADLSAERIAAARRRNPSLQNRRYRVEPDPKPARTLTLSG